MEITKNVSILPVFVIEHFVYGWRTSILPLLECLLQSLTQSKILRVEKHRSDLFLRTF